MILPYNLIRLDIKGGGRMATVAQIEMVLKRVEQARPAHFFKCMDEVQVGIGAVLRLLYDSDEAVTAGKISEELEVSTARVAVLIRKMVSKGLITKEQDTRDARVTIVRLTDFGRQAFEETRDDIYRKTGMVIDTVGEDRLIEFISVAEEIKDTITLPEIHF